MNAENEFEDLLDKVSDLLQSLADQQAMPDDSWKPKWDELREKLEAVTGDLFCNYSE